MTAGRALIELFADTFITFSLTFLVGTVVNDSTACNSVINGDHCQQGGVSISTQVISSTSNGQCQSVEIGQTIQATVLTTALAQIVGAACGFAERTAKENAKRKSRMLAGRAVLTIVLLAFGIGYSFALTSSASGSAVAKRRYETISMVLWRSWIADQVVNAFRVLAQRVGVLVVCILPAEARVPKTNQGPSYVVHPTGADEPLEPPDLNAMVHATAIATPVEASRSPEATKSSEVRLDS